MCVPITGPISETNTGSDPKISRPRCDQRLRLVGVVRVLHDPAVAPVRLHLLDQRHQALERPAAGAHPFDGADLRLQREDRLDLEGRAQPRLSAADAPALAQVLERVEREQELQLCTRLPAPAPRPRRRPRPPLTAAAAASSIRPSAPQAVSESTTCTRSAASPSCSRACSRRAHGAGQATGQVDRDDLMAGVDQRLDRPPGSHRSTAATSSAARWPWRGSRNRRRSRGSRSRAGLSVAVHVEADLVQRRAVRELARQVMAGVGDEGDGHDAR